MAIYNVNKTTGDIVETAGRYGATSAEEVSYDNTDSGLTATDVQEAIDKLAESYPADNVMLSDGVTSVEDALDELTDKFVMQTYTLRYESATNLRVTNITPPTGCSLERMIILPPNYDAVTVKVANILRISTSGIIALGSGFASTDIISLSVLFFRN